MSGTSPGTTTAHGTWRLLLVLVGSAAVAAGLARYATSFVAPVADGTSGMLDALPAALISSLPVDQVVVLVVLAGGTIAAGWMALSALVALVYVVADRTGHRWHAGEVLLNRVAPAAVRRLARSAVGLGVGAGLVLAPSAAFAADSTTGGDADAPASITLQAPAGAAVDLGWQTTSPGTPTPDVTTPDVTTPHEVPATAPPPAPAATPVVRDLRPAADDEAPTHVVLRGDTLWDLAARSLGGSPSDAELLQEVTRWHSANREVIGADPDVILPGQVLHVPG